MNMMVSAATLAPSQIVAMPTEDPVFAMIDRHKAVYAELGRLVSQHSDLEQTLPDDRQRSSIDFFDEIIVETDDPRWIAIERAVMAGHRAERSAACDLVDVCPTTMAGVLALLQYTVEFERRDEWPTDLLQDSEDAGLRGSWHSFMCRNVSIALQSIAAKNFH